MWVACFFVGAGDKSENVGGSEDTDEVPENQEKTGTDSAESD